MYKINFLSSVAWKGLMFSLLITTLPAFAADPLLISANPACAQHDQHTFVCQKNTVLTFLPACTGAGCVFSMASSGSLPGVTFVRACKRSCDPTQQACCDANKYMCGTINHGVITPFTPGQKAGGFTFTANSARC